MLQPMPVRFLSAVQQNRSFKASAENKRALKQIHTPTQLTEETALWKMGLTGEKASSPYGGGGWRRIGRCTWLTRTGSAFRTETTVCG